EASNNVFQFRTQDAFANNAGEALKQFFTLFSEFQSIFYLAGEIYPASFIPYFQDTWKNRIEEENGKEGLQINSCSCQRTEPIDSVHNFEAN
ncbi:unnamed protein product, partial [Allacma fusca]